MMTKDTNKKTERIRFFLAIPLATMIIVCFSFKASLPEQILAPMTANRHMTTDLSPTQDVQKDSLKKDNLQKSKSRQVFIVVEKNASFQDGDLETFRAWVLQNLKYPESAAKKGIQGKVILSFIVEVDGSVNEVKVLRGVDPTLDEEGIRVIKSSPAWIPGRQAGKSVAQQFTMPIAFKLSK
jgi:TonB family protein